DRVLDDQVPADNPGDQLAECRVRVGVSRTGDRNHRGEFGVTECRKPTNDRRDDERQHQRWTGAGAFRSSGGGSADGGEDSGANDGPNADQRYAERRQGSFQAKLWPANLGQNLVQVLGTKNSSKQVSRLRDWVF